MLRGSRSFLLTVVVLLAVPVVLLQWEDLANFIAARAALREGLPLLPYILLALSGLLGARMNQPRVLFASLLLALAYALSLAPGSVLGFPLVLRSSALTLAIPASLLLLAFFRPGKILGRSGALQLALILVPFAGVLVANAWTPDFTRRILFGQVLPWPTHWDWRVPDLGPALAFVLLGSAAFLRDRALRELQAATAISVLPLFLLFGRLEPRPLASTLVFSGIGLVLLYALHRLTWSQVYVDELTGIPNRRALDERLMQLEKRYSIAMADIDFFKKFNDRFGHEEGDNVLRLVASHLHKETGSRAYRYGGEEFCMVFEDLGPDETFTILDGARARLSERDFIIRSRGDGPVPEGEREKVQVTVSIGVATRTAEAHTPEQVLQTADDMLYRAKDEGRDRVVAAPER